MLHLYHSNRLERLLDGLREVVDVPLADPITPELVVVQNQGMARWISQRLAEETGIAANLEFPLPASFAWRAVQSWFPDLPAESGFGREELLWRAMARLPGLLEEPAFAPLHAYLQGEPRALKAWQLCRRIADVFDQYLVYRPEMVLAWERGDDDHWQARLWRVLSGEADGPHRAAVGHRFADAVTFGGPPVGPLPERVALFGLTALAPAHLAVFAALAEYREVHVFLLNPCREYWADIVDERGQARRRARARREGRVETTGLLDVGNPLLASMWHGGQDLLDQLLELDGEEHSLFEDPPADTLLHRLQGDVLDLRDARVAPEPLTVDPADTSVQVHVCHGPLREVQVLHDGLLHLFDTLPGLEPRQVVVMAPDIDQYAPYVDAVFGAAAESERAIPWAVADRRVRAERPLLEAAAWLLALPASRLPASEVLALLEVPAVRRRLGLDEPGLHRVRTWVRESGVRWGSDGAMREKLGLPGEEANTWSFGLARLFLGLAMPTDSGRYAGIAPYPDLEGGEAEALGALQCLVDRLADWRGRLSAPCAAGAWRERIAELLADFFDPDQDEEEALQAVRDAMSALDDEARKAGYGEVLPLDLVQAHLAAALDAPAGGRRFLSGRVTFCNMVPMRSIPFRVVWLLGMNGEDFPRGQRPPGFDLIARHPRRGDRSRRLDDRYLFLEALLSARDVFALSYVGRDIRDNAPKVPSVLVGELLDYLEQGHRLPSPGAGGTGGLRAHLTVEHRLQPFSPRYFDGSDPRLFSYASEWLTAARAERAATVPFADAVLPEATESAEAVELAELIRFLENPARAFLRHTLGIDLPQEAELPEDEEPFAIAGLDKYRLRQQLLAGLAESGDPDEAAERARALGLVPHGVTGRLGLGRQVRTAQAFLARYAELRGKPLDPLEVDVPVAGFRLQGVLGELSDRGLLTGHLGAVRARHWLRLWVSHLVLRLLRPAGSAPESIHLGEDQQLTLDPVDDPGSILGDLLALRREGLRRPLPFFPETSLDWARRRKDDGALRNLWCGELTPFPECADPAFGLAFRDLDPLGDPALFAELRPLAERVYAPLLAVAELSKWRAG
jgi:exodeoxyribonuclease V gamma subunit